MIDARLAASQSIVEPGARDPPCCCSLQRWGACGEAASLRIATSTGTRVRPDHGKGGKERRCRLWPIPASTFRRLADKRPIRACVPEPPCEAITLTAFTPWSSAYVRTAATSPLTFAASGSVPHVIRHSTAHAPVACGRRHHHDPGLARHCVARPQHLRRDRYATQEAALATTLDQGPKREDIRWVRLPESGSAFSAVASQIVAQDTSVSPRTALEPEIPPTYRAPPTYW